MTYNLYLKVQLGIQILFVDSASITTTILLIFHNIYI